MHFDLKYGKSTLPLDIDDGRVLEVVLPKNKPALANGVAAVEQMLRTPLGSKPLRDLLLERKPKRLVIVVNDITRPTPYSIIMPPLMRVIEDAGIPDSAVTLVTATGIHDAHSPEQNVQVYGKELVDRYTLISHDATNESQLVFKGKLESGYDFWLNRTVDESDFLITIGVVMPHYFAGFSGGRKSILPGVAGKETVKKNHARMVELMDELPPIRKNPVSLEMIQAARIAGVDFIVNVVTDDAGQLVDVVAGDLEQAWYKAVESSENLYMTPIKQKADIAIASACGYPRDINLYQTQKALDHADKATNPGATIIIVAECSTGYGEDVFEKFMKAGYTAEGIMTEVKNNFVMGGHKAYGFAKVAAYKKVIFVSAISKEETASLFARKAATVQEALQLAYADQKPGAKVLVMPEGSLTVPVLAK